MHDQADTSVSGHVTINHTVLSNTRSRVILSGLWRDNWRWGDCN